MTCSERQILFCRVSIVAHVPVELLKLKAGGVTADKSQKKKVSVNLNQSKAEFCLEYCNLCERNEGEFSPLRAITTQMKTHCTDIFHYFPFDVLYWWC